jgi:hypothetical protein
MSKKSRKLKRENPQSGAHDNPWLRSDGLHALVSRSTPLPEMLDDMTLRYQKEIRNSPLWDEMVREFGEEEAERVLREFRVEIR